MQEFSNDLILWKQAVQFDSLGGWRHDSQFIDQMGAPYLLATGIGHPVDDAVTRLSVNRHGKYKLWVRCKDWLPSHSPGLFQVSINGEPSEVTFGGAENSEWNWFEGGDFDLNEGEIELRLHDLTGWWARCDAIVLSAEPNFKPSNDPEILLEQRIAFGAVSQEIISPKAYDVVVVGGGLAGVVAAVAAARNGMTVALLQNRPVLGGNTSSEICVPALGDETRQPWDPRETGIIEECDPAITGISSWSTNLQTLVKNEPNLDCFLTLHARDVRKEVDGTIRSVDAIHTISGQRYRFHGTIFIDCSGDAILGYAAGAEFRQGKEDRAEYGEPLAPEEASDHTMGNTLYGGRIASSTESTSFETPPWAYQWKSPEDFEQRPTHGMWSTGELPVHFTNLEKGNGRPPDSAMGPVGCWFAEVGGMLDTIRDAEFIRDELFRICIGLWGYVKNHDSRFQEINKNRTLVELNHIAGKRESRRLLGEYVLTQHDYEKQIVHEDTIAYGGWTIDDHHPQGYFAPGPLAFHAYLQKVSIPYRCLVSKNIPNLMMAGRNISATHVGFSGVRVMRTCALMGQAAGTAAAIAIQNQIRPSVIFPVNIPRLQQQLLKDGAYLLGVRNQDPNDLAKTARVTASSFAQGEDSSWVVAPPSKWGVVHRLDSPKATMFKATDRRIDKVALKLRSRNRKPTPLSIALCPANALGKFNTAEEIALAEANVPPLANDWVEFDLSSDTREGNFYYLKVPATPGIEWELYTYHPPDTLRAFDGPHWGVLWGCYKFKLTPGGEPKPSEYAKDSSVYSFEPENIINGLHRSVEGNPNAWAPDPEENLPQHIELRFDEPKAIDTIHISFQLASLAPSRYSIVIETNSEWRTLLSISKNRKRRQVHHFDAVTTSAIRLILEAPQHNPPTKLMPVCEIRIYHKGCE